MVPWACKNTTLDPSANPFQALGEASPDPLSVVGGPRPSVVVESRAPTPSLFGASPSPFTGGGAGPLPFAANPPTAKHLRSDTSYLPGFTSETDPKSYWVQRFAAAAATQENPSMDALVTMIARFLAEIKANYLAQTDKLRSAIEYTESLGRHTHQGLNRLETQMHSLHQESPTPTPKPTSPAEAGPAPAAPHILAPKPTRPPAVPLGTGCWQEGQEARPTSTYEGTTHCATRRHLLSAGLIPLPAEGDHPQRTPPPHQERRHPPYLLHGRHPGQH